jgi:tRNA(Ile2) C34 agmatinyltransferase TiaS
MIHVLASNLNMIPDPETIKEEGGMTVDADKTSNAESLRATRTYGKFRCHNPSCMGRLQPAAGDKHVKCPMCGMEFRVHWIRPDFPRIRGPVWEVNRKLAMEAIKNKIPEKPETTRNKGGAGHAVE